MRAKSSKKNGHDNGGGRRSTKITNQLAFNVICLALAVGGDAGTEPCESEYNG
jgi:hypothetical protein